MGKKGLSSKKLRGKILYPLFLLLTAALFAQEPPAGMVFVEGGSFMMGSNSGEDDEKPVHRVTVSGFYISDHEVTQGEWQAVMGGNPSSFPGDDNPVENVSWYEALEYCNRLSEQKGLTPVYDNIGEENPTVNWQASGYRLPTEAEWEYAARGGNKSQGYRYSGGNDRYQVAWTFRNSDGQTHPVRQKQPNELGLYDMSGNVWEWCWDWYGAYFPGSQTNPHGPESGSFRISRGGCWYFDSLFATPVNRNDISPGSRIYRQGFRAARNR